MIGRFSQLGTYRQLLRSKSFYLTLAGGAAALASYLVGRQAGVSPLVPAALALAAVAVNGAPIIWGALVGLVKRQVNVDELVSLALVASLAQGDFLAAAVVSFVMTLGSLVEEAASESARRAIKSLIKVTPQTALLIRDGDEVEVPAADLAPGDLVLVRPGDRIPVDGEIRAGSTAVDESVITGESTPREKEPGGEVLAGSINLTGLIRVKALRVGQDTTLGQVVEMVTKAEAHRPAQVRFIDRYATWFTPAILFCAALAWWLGGTLDRAIAVLIVGCPCALILAAPTALVAAMGRAARCGILIKGGAHLEKAAQVDAVLFDKTGTLTNGKPVVSHVLAAPGQDPDRMLRLAAGAESGSNHPLALAVIAAARERGLAVSTPQEARTEAGLGVTALVEGRKIAVRRPRRGEEGTLPPGLGEELARFASQGMTPVLVLEEDQPLGLLGLADPPRPEAAAALDGLRALGIIRLGVVSGDQAGPVAMLAGKLKLSHTWHRLKPQEKPQVIETLAKEGRKVMFVGDGINDAPALALADVGVAMAGSGTEVALETADIALTRDDLSRLPFLISLSRRTLYIIKWNIVFGLVFNAIAVLAGGWGYLSPVAAALTHNIGSVIVVMFSASLVFFQGREPRRA